MGTITVTDSVTLIPSGYTGLTGMTINSSYPIDRGYADADSTNYTRFDVTQSTTGSVYFTFDVSDIPANATITSVTARGKARVNNTTRVTNTVMQLYTNTTAKGSNSTFASTTASTQTITAGSWTRSEISNLRLKIGGTASSSSSSRRIDFYGADVTVNYSYSQTTYDVTVNNSTSVSVTASNTTPMAGESVEITATTLNGINVTDNGTNVNSQFVLISSGSEEEHPTSNTNSNFTLSNIDNAYNGADNTTYAQLQLAGSTTGTIYFNFPSFSLPSGATLQSVSCTATLQFNANSSTSGFTSSFQMYTGSTAKGSATQWVSSGSNVAKNTYTVTMGSWTASELTDAKFYITATNSARSTVRQIYVYGATLTITYQMSSGGVYVYTISNISGDHTIVVSSSGGGSPKLYVKQNGSWVEVQVQTAYKKVNGSWTIVTDLTTLFDSGVNYRWG